MSQKFKGNIQVDGSIKLPASTASRALVINGSNDVAASSVTSTELGHLSGVTSSVQTQLDNKQPLDSDLTALAGLSSNGIIVRSGAGTAVVRSVAAGSAISVSNGDGVAGNPSIALDIVGTTAETVADNADSILVYDSSATANRRMTRANFLAGVPVGSAGDINETSFSLANNQSSPANVTGLVFANATVRSFEVLLSAQVDATADLFESFKIQGVQKSGSWDIAVSSVGDDSQVAFTITSAGQIQYTSGNYSGFVSGSLKFRAITTSI